MNTVKTKRLIISIFLMFITLLNYSVPVHASGCTDNQEFFEFDVNKDLRMSDTGSFTFSYFYMIESDEFKLNSSSCSLMIRATSSTSEQTYYVRLIKRGTYSDTPVGSEKTLTASGNYQYVYFTDNHYNSSDTYYLLFYTPNNNTATFTGEGQLYNITVL